MATQDEDDEDPGAVAAEVERCGLVWRPNSFSSRHTGASWHKRRKKWMARLQRGGNNEHLAGFATEAEAKARYDARCHELGIVADAGESSDFHGVNWHKTNRKT